MRCGVAVEGIEGKNGRLVAVVLESGDRIPADRVVVSVGAIARDEIARQSGLETDNAIIVNSSLQTSYEHVYAIGDCAKFPSIYAETEMRVESVQNATDQARYVADLLSGKESLGYRAVPWFWSQQGDQKLQIAGIAMPGDGARLIESQGGKLVVERIRDERVVAVETINSPGAHIKARRELQETFRYTEARVQA